MHPQTEDALSHQIDFLFQKNCWWNQTHCFCDTSYL